TRVPGGTVRTMKSLLISTYYPPEHGGIAHYMASVAEALGPERVCCLTSVPPPEAAVGGVDGVRVYRRPRAFAAAKLTQALNMAGAAGPARVTGDESWSRSAGPSRGKATTW